MTRTISVWLKNNNWLYYRIISQQWFYCVPLQCLKGLAFFCKIK